jgi:UDP-N-acetylglucosamine acyltransferase
MIVTKATGIDPRATIGPDARVAADVTIGPFTIVEDGAEISGGSVIGANVLLGTGARIGKCCTIHHGAVVGHAPQDLKYANEPTTCEVGERTVIREYSVIHRGTGEGGRTIIGRDCFLMAFTHVAHDCVLGDHVIMANAAMLAGHVTVEDWAIIGGLTPVHQFVRIGRHSMIGGGLRVPKDVPPYTLAGNTPLVFEGLNHIGLRRRGFSREALEALDRTYTLLYRSGRNVSQALQAIRADAGLYAVPEVQTVVAFLEESKRGIIGAPRLSS